MKYTDLSAIIDAVKNIEKKELIQALQLHGGKYIFNEEDVVPIEFYDDYKGPCSGTVQRVDLTGNQIVSLQVTDLEDDQYRIESDAVYPGLLSGIIDALPEPRQPKKRQKSKTITK